MATGTAGNTARQFDWQAVHTLRLTVNYNGDPADKGNRALQQGEA